MNPADESFGLIDALHGINETLLSLDGRLKQVEERMSKVEKRVSLDHGRLGIVEDASINHESRLQELEEREDAKE